MAGEANIISKVSIARVKSIVASVMGGVPEAPINGQQYARQNGAWAVVVGGGGGSGDMILANAQTVTGAKTFNNGTLLMRNVANTFSSQFTNTNTAARTYTLPDFSGNNFVLNNGLNSSTVINSMVGNTRITGDGAFILSNLNTVGATHASLVITLPSSTTTNLPLRAFTLGGGITIGTSSPSTMINVNASITLNASGQNYSSLSILGSILDAFSNTIIGINYNPSISSSGVHYAAIFGSGRVGIGTLTPTEVLDVAGNIKFSGALMANNTAGTSGQVLISQGSGSAPIWGSVELQRMTTTQRDAIPTPSAGMLIYNTSTNVYNFYNGTTWNPI